MRVVAQRLEHRHAPVLLPDQRVQRPFARLVVDELVELQLRHQRAAHAVVGVAVLLPGFEVLAVRVPETGFEPAHAGVEEVVVLQHLVVGVVLGGEAERARLDAHVDVFRHQDHAARGLLLLQVAHHREDLVVGLAGRQRRRQVAVDRLGLQEQAPAGRRPVLARLDRQPGGDIAALGRDDLVEEAARLARVARHVRKALLVAVELLQRAHRQVEVVLLEAEQAGRVVHQHVRVEHEQLLDLRFSGAALLLLRHCVAGRGFRYFGWLDIIGF